MEQPPRFNCKHYYDGVQMDEDPMGEYVTYGSYQILLEKFETLQKYIARMDAIAAVAGMRRKKNA